MYAVIDVETTGGDGYNHKITEIAIYKTDGQKEIERFSTLLNPGRPIPYFITNLTGITDEMVAKAPPFYEVAEKIVRFTESCTFVAHNANFDYSVIRNEFKQLGYTYQRSRLCTGNLARNLVKGLRSYSLGSICRHFNIKIKARHRAYGDAEATMILFNKLLALKEEDEISIKKNLPPNIRAEQIDTLPEATGVYYFLDSSDQNIYIGKSKNIKSRVLDHFRNYSSIRSVEMIQQVSQIRYHLTGSELIALLHESFEIKNLQPRYNRALRRKVLPWGIYTSDKEGYLQLQVKKVNGAKQQPIRTFSSQKAAKGFLHGICKEHRLCQTLCGLYKNASNSCLLFQLNVCEGACAKLEPAEYYNKRVMNVLDLQEEEDSFLVIDQGRTEYEKSVLLVENGRYKGFGYIDEYELNWGIEVIKSHLYHKEDHRDVYTIIKGYLKRNKVEKILSLSDGFLTGC